MRSHTSSSPFTLGTRNHALQIPLAAPAPAPPMLGRCTLPGTTLSLPALVERIAGF